MHGAGNPALASAAHVVFGVRWDGRGCAVVLAAAALIALFAALVLATGSSSSSDRALTLVVTGDGAQKAVEAAGGSVQHVVEIVDGVVARVPAGEVGSLRAAPGVRSVTEDGPFSLSTDVAVPPTAEAVALENELTVAETAPTPLAPDANPAVPDPTVAEADPILADAPAPAPVDSAPASATTLTEARTAIGADTLPATTARVDVALVDSGITPLGPLAEDGKVLHGADFSPDARNASLRHLDAFGHGTHLAGLIAGVAPESRLINVKVADAEGETSLVQLLLGINWVVNHRDRDGRNIKVLNLAVGSDNLAGYVNEPLAYAVEKAWRHGITVVAAAGNQGAAANRLDLPAADPFILAVAGVDTKGTGAAADDTIADWSSRGDGTRDPDIAAPGSSMLSVRVPSSFLDELFPEARVGEDRFRGSGTSQSAAVASAAAAMLVARHAGWTPNQVKAALRQSARPLGAGSRAEGKGALDVAAANAVSPADAAQPFTKAVKPSMRELYRRVAIDSRNGGGTNLEGRRWSGRRWSGVKWSGVKWSGVKW